MHRLYGARCYLIGAMDRAPDRGVGWRAQITPFIQHLGVIVMNPCDKPIDIGLEEAEGAKQRKILKAAHKWDDLEKTVKVLRSVDLRMCDISDFIICHLDTTIHACGTYEEITTTNREKKPVLIYCEQGIEGIPDWLFGVLPYQFFFNSWDEMKRYLFHIHTAPEKEIKCFKRWMFFDYSRMLPNITPEDSEQVTLL